MEGVPRCTSAVLRLKAYQQREPQSFFYFDNCPSTAAAAVAAAAVVAAAVVAATPSLPPGAGTTTTSLSFTPSKPQLPAPPPAAIDDGRSFDAAISPALMTRSRCWCGCAARVRERGHLDEGCRVPDAERIPPRPFPCARPLASSSSRTPHPPTPAPRTSAPHTALPAGWPLA